MSIVLEHTWIYDHPLPLALTLDGMSIVSYGMLILFIMSAAKCGGEMAPDVGRITRIQRGEEATEAHMDNDRDIGTSGIGGWLILPAIGLVLGLIVSVYNFVSAFTIFDEITGANNRAMLVIGTFYQTLMIPFLVAVAVCFFRKHSKTKRMIIYYIIFNLIWTGQLVAMSIALNADPFTLVYVKGFIRLFLAAAIWIPYFCLSKRVKATFVN